MSDLTDYQRRVHEPQVEALTRSRDWERKMRAEALTDAEVLRDQLAEERRVRKLLAEALVIAGDALRTCKVEAEADTGDPVWHLPNLIALTVDEPRLRIAAALAESDALDGKP